MPPFPPPAGFQGGAPPFPPNGPGMPPPGMFPGGKFIIIIITG